MFTVTEESHSTEPLSLRHQDAPATLKLETIGEGGASSQVRGAALSYRDSTSVCSTSSLSTDLSATLSLGNDDVTGDFVVTWDSSAVVDFHDFSDFSRFPQTPPINSIHRNHPPQHYDKVAVKKESPFVNFLNRYAFVCGCGCWWSVTWCIIISRILLTRFWKHDRQNSCSFFK